MQTRPCGCGCGAPILGGPRSLYASSRCSARVHARRQWARRVGREAPALSTFAAPAPRAPNWDRTSLHGAEGWPLGMAPEGGDGPPMTAHELELATGIIDPNTWPGRGEPIDQGAL